MKPTAQQQEPDEHSSNRNGNGGGAGDDGGDEDKGEDLGRTIAEWVTLGLSVAIVAGLGGYLLYHALQPDTPYVNTQVRPIMDQVGHEGGRYFLPVEIHNNGRRTLRDFTAELTYRAPDGTRQARDIKLDFLAENARETRYFYFDEDPRGLQVEARPVEYGLR